jgi:hypothetical protein
MVGGEPQESAAKKAGGGIVVPDLVPLGQLQPGAAPEVILAVVNAGSAKIDNLELMLELVAGDLMESSKRASAFEIESRAAWRAFDTRIGSGNISTTGARANYAAAVLTPPQPTPPMPVQPSLSQPLLISPRAHPAPLGPAPQPVLDLDRCKVKLECLTGTFKGPTTSYVFAEMHRAGVPLPSNVAVYWPNNQFMMLVVTFPSLEMASNYVEQVNRFLDSVLISQRWFSSAERSAQVQQERTGQLWAVGAQQARGPVQEAANLMERLKGGDPALQQFA